jgi:hypothetical protein
MIAATAGLVAGCLPNHPILMEGNAEFARVQYTGDLTTATPLAARHCAGFERVAVLRARDSDTALFDCVRR